MKKITVLLGICFFVFTACFANAQPAPSFTNNALSQGYYNNPSENKINWQPSYQAAVSASRSLSKPILILFTGTSWCPACLTLERNVLTKPEFAQAIGNQLIFLKAEFSNHTAEYIETSPFKFLLDRYKVDTFPTMIIINPEGHVLFSVAYQGGKAGVYINDILNQLKYANSNSYQHK